MLHPRIHLYPDSPPTRNSDLKTALSIKITITLPKAPQPNRWLPWVSSSCSPRNPSQTCPCTPVNPDTSHYSHWYYPPFFPISFSCRISCKSHRPLAEAGYWWRWTRLTERLRGGCGSTICAQSGRSGSADGGWSGWLIWSRFCWIPECRISRRISRCWCLAAIIGSCCRHLQRLGVSGRGRRRCSRWIMG